MPRFSPEQIYAFAREAGFSPDQSATMTAIALAESGGDSRAHATRGEDSRGLWQINAAAHPDLARQFDLYDPVQNARAAFLISRRGGDVSPWTTTHGGLSARYLRYRDEAEAAAAAYDDGTGHGVWTGTAGYGHRLAAGDPHGGSEGTQGGSTTGSGQTGGGHQGSGSQGSGQTAGTGAHGAGSDAVVNQSTLIGVHHGGHVRPGEEFGIVLDGDDTSGGVRAGAAFGIPLETVAGAQTAAGTQTGADAGTHQSAANSRGTHGAEPTAATGDQTRVFLDAALAQTGDRYVFGANVQLNNPDPTTFDCSGLVKWAAHQAGVELDHNAWEQYRDLRAAGAIIPVDQAIDTPGALLFSFSSDPDGRSQPGRGHVAISLGDGHTIEAKGSKYGVGQFDASTNRFQFAAVIPGISDRAGTAAASGSGAASGAVTGGTDAADDTQVGIVLPALAPDQAHPLITAPAEPTVATTTTSTATTSVSTGDDFDSLLDTDPDRLDSGGDPWSTPLTVLGTDQGTATSQSTAADPGTAAGQSAAAGGYQQPGFADADADGLDDSLAQSLHWYGVGGIGWDPDPAGYHQTDGRDGAAGHGDTPAH